jgi:hypothetical protein
VASSLLAIGLHRSYPSVEIMSIQKAQKWQTPLAAGAAHRNAPKTGRFKCGYPNIFCEW